MTSYYRFTGEQDRFRVIAYQNAAKIIDHLTEDISNFSKEELIDIHGIGEGTVSKFVNILKPDESKSLRNSASKFRLILRGS